MLNRRSTWWLPRDPQLERTDKLKQKLQMCTMQLASIRATAKRVMRLPTRQELTSAGLIELRAAVEKGGAMLRNPALSCMHLYAGMC